MKARTRHGSLGLWMAIVMLLTSCSKSTRPEVEPTSGPTEETPNTYPPIPRPSTPDEVIPDTSDVYTLVMPIANKGVDFAPTWSEGVFTWRVDIQTQYEQCFTTCEWTGDAPGIYWQGTRHSSDMTFQNGLVDLRNPTPFWNSSRRLLFVENGQPLAIPRNAEHDADIYFNFQGGYTSVHLTGVFGGQHVVEVEPGFLERQRHRKYYVAALSSPPITKPVYLKRERFWVRLPLVGNGSNLKSIRVDPGSSFSVSYTRTEGTSTADATTFTRTISADVEPAILGDVGLKLSGSLSQAFETTVTISEETSTEVTRTMNGMDGKTVIYSVWASVERYSVVDQQGNRYTDPNFTFVDLGTARIQGEYEWISSTAFDYQ